jgi:pilus assembly protein Flp/PilA
MLEHYLSLTNRLARLPRRLSGLRKDERGVTSVEYGLMVALIAIVIIGAVAFVGHSLTGLFNTVGSSLGGTG